MPSICTIEHSLQFASAVFAALAALTWLWASRVKAPSEIAEEQMRRPLAAIPVVDLLMKAVARQSRLNASAALFAGLAAFCQLPQAFLPTCWG